MANVDLALIDVQGQLAKVAPIVEGLRDFQRLNLQPDTQTEISAALKVYLQRVALLEAAQLTLRDLIADGPTDLPDHQITETAMLDLEQNRDTIAAALAQFASGGATSFSFSAGPELLK